MLLQEWRSISVQCFLLSRVIFPLHTLPLGQVLNSLCNLPLYLAKKNNSDLMLGHDLEYLRNYKTWLRLKIVMLVFFLTPLLVILQDFKFRFNGSFLLQFSPLSSVTRTKVIIKCIVKVEIYKISILVNWATPMVTMLTASVVYYHSKHLLSSDFVRNITDEEHYCTCFLRSQTLF